MTHRTEYPDGAPCWVGLTTPDVDGARRFYGELLGWSFEPPDPNLNNYVNARVRDHRVAGLSSGAPGQPPAWGVWLSSSDIAATARQIEKAGGKLLYPVHPVAALGKMLIAEDPTGVPFGVWEPGEHRGSGLHDEPGATCWHEFYSRDPAASDAFFRTLFDYTSARIDLPNCDLVLYKVAGQDVCTRMASASCGDAPAGWQTFFSVADVDAAAARIPTLGGVVNHGPVDLPLGRTLWAADPSGAMFALVQRPQRA